MVGVAKGDPNFPEGGLNIAPSHDKYKSNRSNSITSNDWKRDSQNDIERWGIAGRVWEAAYILTRYLSCPTNDDALYFDPPCSLFLADEKEKRNVALELGAGVGVAGIHLALELAKSSRGRDGNSSNTIVLTDLDNVLPLLQRNIKRANLDKTVSDSSGISVQVRALPWGSTDHADQIRQELSPSEVTHIICSDLVYFPELLSPLLRSLIYLTSHQSSSNDHHQQKNNLPIEVIIGYKLRSHSKEEPFWRAFGVWFNFYPVLCRDVKSKTDWRRFGSLCSDFGQSSKGKQDNESIPSEDEMFVFVAHRKESTLNCTAPDDDERLLGGWLLREETLERGNGAESFELLLMNAIQD